MAITIKIDTSTQQGASEPPKPPQATAHRNIRKMLDGTLVMFDHPEIDIAIIPHKNKIVAFAKDEMGDHIYATQSRLFDFLCKKGVIELGTIQGGNIYGSLEAVLPQNDDVDPVQVAVFTIGKFVDEEIPYFDRVKQYEKEFEEYLLEPDDENSTEHGEVPHQPRKGTIHRWPGAAAAYGLTGMYRA